MIAIPQMGVPGRHLLLLLLSTFLVLGWVGIDSYRTLESYHDSMDSQLRVRELEGKIIFLDEVLTMSARMCAATGDLRWEERYRMHESELDQCIKEAARIASTRYSASSLRATEEANNRLVAMENSAFDLVRRNKRTEAAHILSGPEYERQKSAYSEGIAELASILGQVQKNLHLSERRKLHVHWGAYGLIAAILVVSWTRIIRAMRTWEGLLSEQNDRLLRQSSELEQLNASLEGQVRDRTRQIRDLARFTDENNNPILRVSASGDILYANRMSNYLLNAWKTGMNESLPSAWRQLVEDALRLGRSRTLEETIEDKCYSFVILPLVDIESVFIYGQDVSEHKRIEGELRQSQKMEAVGQLAGGIAHDFNNALASILGYIKLAQGASSMDEARDDLRQASGAGERARELVERLLSFSRHAPPAKAMVPTRLEEVIREVVRMLRPVIPSTVEIRANITPNLPSVVADAAQLHQMLVNLCTNASQAMPRGGRMTLTLQQISLTDEDCAYLFGTKEHEAPEAGIYVVLSVEDTGEGIPKEVLPRIFEPFFTTKKSKINAGMGLATAYGIIKQHRAAIRVYSEVGRGTNFRVYFHASGLPGTIALDTPPPLRGGNESILVVDDEESLAKMMAKSLTRLGYRVSMATGSLEALEMFKQNPAGFDLVITDQTMPRMTGDQLVRQIVAWRADVPVILCTGFSDILAEDQQGQLPIARLLRKPFIGDELEREVRIVLDRGKTKTG